MLTRQQAAARLIGLPARPDCQGADLTALERAIRIVRSCRYDRGTGELELIEAVFEALSHDDL